MSIDILNEYAFQKTCRTDRLSGLIRKVYTTHSRASFEDLLNIFVLNTVSKMFSSNTAEEEHNMSFGSTRFETSWTTVLSFHPAECETGISTRFTSAVPLCLALFNFCKHNSAVDNTMTGERPMSACTAYAPENHYSFGRRRPLLQCWIQTIFLGGGLTFFFDWYILWIMLLLIITFRTLLY